MKFSWTEQELVAEEEKEAASTSKSCPPHSTASQGAPALERRIETRRHVRAKHAAATPDGQEGESPTTKDTLPRNPELHKGERRTAAKQEGRAASPSTYLEDKEWSDTGSKTGSTNLGGSSAGGRS